MKRFAVVTLALLVLALAAPSFAQTHATRMKPLAPGTYAVKACPAPVECPEPAAAPICPVCGECPAFPAPVQATVPLQYVSDLPAHDWVVDADYPLVIGDPIPAPDPAPRRLKTGHKIAAAIVGSVVVGFAVGHSIGDEGDHPREKKHHGQDCDY